VSDKQSRRPTKLRTISLALLAALIGPQETVAAENLRIATYNLRNFRHAPTTHRPAKSPVERIAVRRVIQQIAADVVALQEVGQPESLAEFVGENPDSVGRYPYVAFCQGADPHNHLATLSRDPITYTEAHNDLNFLLYGRKTPVARGFLETRIQASPGFEIILINAHLKSKRGSAFADDDSIRREEAILLLKLSQKLAREHPSTPQIIAGDLNDTPDSIPLRILTGKNHLRFVDLAPKALLTDSRANWTYFFPEAETYSRIDYVLLDSRLEGLLDFQRTFVWDSFDTRIASDHRPVVMTLTIPQSSQLEVDPRPHSQVEIAVP